ncbi:MAG: IS1182 family transposase [Chloroflexota bacterium]
MSLQWQLPRDVPDDTGHVGRAILPPQDIYRQIGDRFDRLFPYEDCFAPLYEHTGRGAISPLLLALVTVFQMLEKVPDREAATWVVSRIDWKYALHLPLAYTGFHFCDLSAFRQRLLEHRQERLVFDALLERLKELGLLKRRGKARTDSTHILAVVERLTQLELVGESIRVALRAVTGAAEAWAGEHLPATFREAYQERQSQYGLGDEEARQELVKVGADGFWFLAQVDRSAPAAARDLAEVATLRAVLAQQFPQGPGGPPAEKRPHGVEVIESPHEAEARRGVKRSKSWTGYKVQLSETCDEGLPHLVVDLEPTPAPAHDSPQLPAIQARLGARQLLPGEQYVDQSYVSGKAIAASEELGVDLKGKPLADTSGPEGFRQGDFLIDEEKREAVCPAGERSARWREVAGEAGEPARVDVQFEGSTCRVCGAFGSCTESARGRSLELHPYRRVLQARRLEAQTAAYREELKVRAGVEGSISELVRGHGLRQARYRGLGKLRLQCLFTAVAVDLKRLVRWWNRPPGAAARVDGARAALALAGA